MDIVDLSRFRIIIVVFQNNSRIFLNFSTILLVPTQKIRILSMNKRCVILHVGPMHIPLKLPFFIASFINLLSPSTIRRKRRGENTGASPC